MRHYKFFIILILFLLVSCIPKTIKDTVDYGTNTVQENELQTSEEIKAFDDQIIEELKSNPNYELSYVQALETIYGPISQSLIDFKTKIGQFGTGIVDESKGVFDINQYGLIYFRSNDGRLYVFNRLDPQGNYLTIRLEDAFEKYKEIHAETTVEYSIDNFGLSTKYVEGPLLVLLDQEENSSTNVIFNLDTKKWEERKNLFATHEGFLQSDPKVISFLTNKFFRNEIDYPIDLTSEQTLAFESMLNEMKVSNLSEYGSLVIDPRILSRLNKGVVYDIEIQKNILKVHTPFAIFLYDINTNEQISYIPFDFYSKDSGLILDGKYLLVHNYREWNKSNKISLYETNTGKKKWEYEGIYRVLDWVVDPEEKFVIFSCITKDLSYEIRFLYLNDGQEATRNRIKTPFGGNLLFSTDNKQLIQVADEILYYDAQNYKLLDRTPGMDEVLDAYLSADGSYMVLYRTTRHDLPISIFKRTEDGKYAFHFTTNAKSQYGFIGDSNNLLIRKEMNEQESIFQVIDLDYGGKTILDLEFEAYYDLCPFELSDGKNGIAYIQNDGNLVLHNLDTETIQSLDKGFFTVWWNGRMRLSRDGKTLLVNNFENRNIILYDANTGALLNNIIFEGLETDGIDYWLSYDISPSKQFVVAQYVDGRRPETDHFFVFRADTGEIKKSIQGIGRKIVYSNDNEEIVYIANTHELFQFNLETETRELLYNDKTCEISDFSLSQDDRTGFMVISCDSIQTKIVAADFNHGTIKEYLLPNNQISSRFRYAISPDDQYLVFSYQLRDTFFTGMQGYDLKTGALLFDVEVQSVPIALSINTEKKWIAAGYHDTDFSNIISIFDLRDGSELFNFGLAYNYSTFDDILFTPDGKRLITTSNVMDVWDVTKLSK